MMHHIFEEVIAGIAIETRGEEAEPGLECRIERTLLCIRKPLLCIKGEESGVGRRPNPDGLSPRPPL